MDIEEDIKKVKELNNLLKFFKTHGWIPDLSREINTNGIIDAIDHILAEREADKKRIEELKENNIYLVKYRNVLEEEIFKNNKDYIPKQKVKEVIKKIKEILDIAEEQIESKIIIADSDSLNFGRKQAHGKDIELIEKLLEDK